MFIVRSRTEGKDLERKNTTPSSTEVFCTSIRKMKDKNLSMEMVYVYHGRGCLRLCRACRRSVCQGESLVKFMELGSASAVLGEECLCRQISMSMVVMLTDSTCLCYQVSLNVGQIPHQDLEG